MNYPTIASIMNPKYRKVEEPTEPPVPTPMLLDTYDAYLAYSFRKLRTDYTGACIRVRRSSDNTEQDIGFVDGYIDKTTLIDFVGNNRGLITIWYDQSGNNWNWAQSNHAYQPFVINDGVLQEVDGKVAMYSASASNLVTPIGFASENILDVSVVQIPVSNNFFILGNGNNNSKFYCCGQDGSTSSTYSSAGNPELYVDNVLIANNRDAYHAAITGADIRIVSNTGLSLANWDQYSSRYPASSVQSVNHYFEKILFVDDSNRAATENNINSYYSL